MNTHDRNPPEQARTSGAYSGRSPEEIESDIERTREKLDRTLDALQSKLSPRKRLQAATDSAREAGGRLVNRAAQSITPGITTMIRLDHTHVLALFRRLRPRTSASRKQAIVANACLALEIHAKLEEEIFYPALREMLGANDVLDKSVTEHDEMRSLIGTLRSLEVGGSEFELTFHRLMRSVLHHVADEESMLLPQAENLLGNRLAELGMRMTKRRVELLRPKLGEVALNSARSFPVATAAVAASLLAVGWFAVRPRHGGH